MELIKDKPLRDRRAEIIPAPAGHQTHDLQSFALLECALLLCYNHCLLLIAAQFVS